jgi:hypothetical protein
MEDTFIVKESIDVKENPSGMHRGSNEGKPNYRLIHIPFLTRFAVHLGKGAKIYGKGNWKKANSQEELEHAEESAERHLMQWLDGERDEDHAMAVVFNIMVAEHVREKLQHGA